MRDFDSMLEAAQVVAGSPQALLAAVERMIKESLPFQPEEEGARDVVFPVLLERGRRPMPGGLWLASGRERRARRGKRFGRGPSLNPRIRRCGGSLRHLDSNVGKLKAFVPAGGAAGIPAYVLREQGGEVLGFKCGGSYVAANTPRGDAWRTERLKEILRERLGEHLEALDCDLVDGLGETDARPVTYTLLRV